MERYRLSTDWFSSLKCSFVLIFEVIEHSTNHMFIIRYIENCVLRIRIFFDSIYSTIYSNIDVIKNEQRVCVREFILSSTIHLKYGTRSVIVELYSIKCNAFLFLFCFFPFIRLSRNNKRNTCLSSQWNILVYLYMMYFRLFNCRFYLSPFVVFAVVVVVVTIIVVVVVGVIVTGFFVIALLIYKTASYVYRIFVWYHDLEWMLGIAVK